MNTTTQTSEPNALFKGVSVLLAEDDPNLGTFLAAYLSGKGLATTLYPDGESALNAFQEGTHNFIISDVMLPKRDGFSLIKEIRKTDSSVPVLFLTAKTLENDRLRGFQIGGDDYMTKPFSMDELMLRVQAILRRTRPSGNTSVQTVFDLGDVSFDYTTRRLTDANGYAVDLTTREADLLQLLCLKEDSVVERREALTHVWKSDNYFNTRSMDVYVNKLRKALKEVSAAEIINVHGVGFKLITNRNKHENNG